MAGAEFVMDPNFERNLAKLVRPGAQKIARDYEKMFDSLARRYKGQPVDEIKPALRREWRKVAGGDITDPELTKYAEHIRDGVKIKMRT